MIPPKAPNESESEGSFEKLYPASIVPQIAGWLTGIAAIGIGGFCTFAAIVPIGKNSPPPGILLAGGGAFAFAGALLVFGGFYIRGTVYGLSQEGLARIQFGKRSFFPWQDIQAIFEGVAPNPTNFWVALKNGKRLHITWVTRNVSQLGRMLQARMTERLLPAAQSTLDSNAFVSFGQIEIGKSEIHYKKKSLAWSEVQCVFEYFDPRKGGGTSVQVYKKNSSFPWCSTAAYKVPNIQLFRTIVQIACPGIQSRRPPGS